MIKFVIPKPVEPKCLVVKAGSLPTGTFFQVVNAIEGSLISVSEVERLASCKVAGIVINNRENQRTYLRFSPVNGGSFTDSCANLSNSECVVLDYNLELTPKVS